VLAELVNYAGEGLPLYLWGKMAGPGETASEVGEKRAARETGSFSYRNATIIEHEGHAAGSLIGYGVPDEPEPIPSDMPALFLPLQKLENLAPDTWYVNVLAVLPEYRGAGLGTKLLGLAEANIRKTRNERHRFQCKHGSPQALRTARLPRGGTVQHGQGGLDQRWNGMGPVDQVAVNWLAADELIE
jgi:GNAT superfamily N-acetyltransferase